MMKMFANQIDDIEKNCTKTQLTSISKAMLNNLSNGLKLIDDDINSLNAENHLQLFESFLLNFKLIVDSIASLRDEFRLNFTEIEEILRQCGIMYKQNSTKREMSNLFGQVCATIVDYNDAAYQAFFLKQLNELKKSNEEWNEAVKVSYLGAECKFKVAQRDIQFILENFFNELCSFDEGQVFVEKQIATKEFAAFVLEKIESNNCVPLDAQCHFIQCANDTILSKVTHYLCDQILLKENVIVRSIEEYLFLQKSSALLCSKLKKLWSEDGDPEMDIFEDVIDDTMITKLKRVKNELERREE